MKRFRELLKGKTDLKNILVSGSGGSVAQVIQFACIPVVTRLYNPEEYGIWMLVFTVAAIGANLCTFRYEVAIVLPESVERAADTFLLSVFLVIASTTLFGGALLIAGRHALRDTDYSPLIPWLWSIPLLVIGRGIQSSCVSWCTRIQAFSLSAASQIALAFSANLCHIAFGLLGYQSATALILGSVIGQWTATTLLLLLLTCNGSLGSLRKSSFRGAVRAAIEYRNFPYYTVPYTIVGTLKERAVLFLLATFSTATVVGYYAFSTRLITAPITLISNGIRPVVYQRAASSTSSGLQSLVDTVLNVLTIVCLPFLVLFLFHAVTAFEFFFGSEWRGAAGMAMVLSIHSFFCLHRSWMDRLLDSKGRQKLALQLETVFGILSLVSFSLGILIFGNVLIAIVLQVCALVAYHMTYIAVIYRIFEFDFSSIGRLLLRILVLGIVFSTLNIICLYFLPSEVAATTLGLLGSCLVLAAALRRFIKTTEGA